MKTMSQKDLLSQKTSLKESVTPFLGIYEDYNIAVAKAKAAQEKLIELSLEARINILQSIRKEIRQNAESLSQFNLNEVKMGNLEGKLAKHLLVANKTPGIEYMQTNNISLFDPIGVILSFIPSTNASETISDHTIGIIAAGNSGVFCPNPRGLQTCKKIIHLLNSTIIEAGGPEDLVTLVDAPRRSVINDLMQHPSIELIVATGGSGIINAVLDSGKKAICAGSGNPPVIVDEDADLELAAESIINSLAFEYNILCVSEKEAFVLEPIYDKFISIMEEKDAYLLSEQQTEALCENIFLNYLSDEKHKKVNKEFIGQSPQTLLESIGIVAPENIRLLIAETAADHALVTTECLLPLLPIVKVSNINQAIAHSVIVEGGRNHSAAIYTNTPQNAEKFRSLMPTTAFGVNQSPLNSFPYFCCTIATKTGEGLVCAKDFVKN